MVVGGLACDTRSSGPVGWSSGPLPSEWLGPVVVNKISGVCSTSCYRMRG